jgi:hypothetical protein
MNPRLSGLQIFFAPVFARFSSSGWEMIEENDLYGLYLAASTLGGLGKSAPQNPLRWTRI